MYNKTYVLLMIFGIVWFSCGKKKESITPQRKDIIEAVYASGVIKSQNQYEVYSTVQGVIKEIYVTEGEMIDKGQPLILIENETSKILRNNAAIAAKQATLKANDEKLQELKQNINLAKLKLQNDSLLYVRQKQLFELEIGSKTELEQKQLNYYNALTQYQNAVLRYNDFIKQLDFSEKQTNNNLMLSEKQQNDYLIKSLIKGKVYAIYRQAGELVNTQQPLAVLGSDKNFMVELQIDEYDIAKIKKGQKVLVTLDSYKGKVFEAVIDKVYPMMNERTKSFKVDASFLNAPEVLYPNLTTEANIIISQKNNVLTIPRSFITDDDMVKLADGSFVKVNTGIKDLTNVEIVSGLNEADQILMP